MLPPHAPPEFADRNTLWNSAEAQEKQWNSQLARVVFREQLLAALVGSGGNGGFVITPFDDGDFTVRAWQECALLSPGFRAKK